MWIARHMLGVVHTYAREFKVVAIIGPRQSGKTTLARYAFPDHPYVNLEELDQRKLAQDDQSALSRQRNRVRKKWHTLPTAFLHERVVFWPIRPDLLSSLRCFCLVCKSSISLFTS